MCRRSSIIRSHVSGITSYILRDIACKEVDADAKRAGRGFRHFPYVMGDGKVYGLCVRAYRADKPHIKENKVK